jgi:hypothetical protein
MAWLSFFLAGRIWRVFSFAFTSKRGDQLHQEQENHHRHNPFQQEYLEFLERHEIPYDTRYISSQLNN